MLGRQVQLQSHLLRGLARQYGWKEAPFTLVQVKAPARAGHVGKQSNNLCGQGSVTAGYVQKGIRDSARRNQSGREAGSTSDYRPNRILRSRIWGKQ
jgi:hypothetical protein